VPDGDEGLSSDDALSPLQTAFRKHHALQCGFCTPGMLTTAHALLTEEPDADADRIRSALSGNPLTAASATFALNAALCFFRVRFMSCSCATGAF
jgi:xanthine dehydrogenase iron-sulfur cluster and FAD-binding subunit A